MSIFPQPEESNENQEVLSQLVTRINDIDRRLRIVEQAISNQKLNINNLNENFISHRKDTERRIDVFDQKLDSLVEQLTEIQKKVELMADEMKRLSTAAELSELKTKSILSSEIEKGSSNLDLALDALERHGNSLEEELK